METVPPSADSWAPARAALATLHQTITLRRGMRSAQTPPRRPKSQKGARVATVATAVKSDDSVAYHIRRIRAISWSWSRRRAYRWAG